MVILHSFLLILHLKTKLTIMMKRFFLPLAILAIALASCDTTSKDSYTTMGFGEYNLISDLTDTSKPAQVSSGSYSLKLNWTQNCVDLSTTSLTINNQKISFETDTMALKIVYLVPEGGGSYIEMGAFGNKSNVGKGAEITNLDGYFTPAYYNVNGLYVPEVETTIGSAGYRMIMGYDLNDQYHVQTFWPMCYYVGKSYVSGTETFATEGTAYRVELNFEKNQARVVIYYPAFTSSDKDVPKAIVLDEIPILFGNKYYYLEADAPKTRVLGSKDNVIALVDSEQYQVSKFSLTMADPDLTHAVITYRIDGKLVTFDGSSIVKATK